MFANSLFYDSIETLVFGTVMKKSYFYLKLVYLSHHVIFANYVYTKFFTDNIDGYMNLCL